MDNDIAIQPNVKINTGENSLLADNADVSSDPKANTQSMDKEMESMMPKQELALLLSDS